MVSLTPDPLLFLHHFLGLYSWGLMGVTVLVVMVPTVLIFIRRQPEDLGMRPDGEPLELESEIAEAEGVPAASAVDTDPVWTLQEALRTRTLWILIIALNLVSFPAGVIGVHMVPYFTLVQGMSAQGASYVLTARLFTATLSRILWGFLVERVPVRVCLAISFLFRSMGPISLVVVPYPYNIVAVALSSAVGGALGILQPMVFANYYGRRFTGSIQGTMRPLLTISPLTGPLLVALLYDATESFNLAFIIATGLGLLSTVVVLFAKPPVSPALSAQPAVP